MAEIKTLATNPRQGGLSLAFSDKTRVTKHRIICQALSGSLGEWISQAFHQNTAHNT
ncbi:MAG: hypothetical protein ABSH06_32100 [Thermodesulfobacteriota bacterium]